MPTAELIELELERLVTPVVFAAAMPPGAGVLAEASLPGLLFDDDDVDPFRKSDPEAELELEPETVPPPELPELPPDGGCDTPDPPDPPELEPPDDPPEPMDPLAEPEDVDPEELPVVLGIA